MEIIKLNRISNLAWVTLLLRLRVIIIWKISYYPRLIEFWTVKLVISSKFPLEAVFLFDVYSWVFGGRVLLITSRIFIFSQDYIKEESFYNRFHLLVLAFVLSIIALIFSLNIISIILGWDGLGLSSYLLVIYYQRPKSFNAGILTALSNRIGDVFIIASCALATLLESTNFYIENLRNLRIWSPLILLVLIASITKRAQIPYSAWLPAAIAAPTPVSALVHSSTLVTAGVYLIFRFRWALEKPVLETILWLGTLTIVIAGISALREIDSKKVVALSTLRQLGLIFSGLGLSAQKIAFFHLIIHAFIKAMLFVTIGNTIHSSFSSQDLRVSGQRELTITISRAFMLVANSGLMGIPFLAGFYSKDLWLEFSINKDFNISLMLLFYVRVSLTVIYSLRLILIIFLKNSKELSMGNYKDWDSYNMASMGILWAMTLTFGSLAIRVLITVPFLREIRINVKNFTLDVIFLSILVAMSINYISSKSKTSLFLKNLWGLTFFRASTSRLLVNPLSKYLNIYLETKSKVIESTVTRFFKAFRGFRLDELRLTLILKHTFGLALVIAFLIILV